MEKSLGAISAENYEVVETVPTPLVSREQAVAAVEAFLESKHCVLWPSGGWTITHPDRRREAAEWFADEMDRFGTWVEGHPEALTDWLSKGP